MNFKNLDHHEGKAVENFESAMERLDSDLTEAKEKIEELESQLSDLQSQNEELGEQIRRLESERQ